MEVTEIKRNVIWAIKQIIDPEVPINIYDLGLIYEINIDEDQNVHIVMTHTSPTCPNAEYMMHELREAVKDAPGVMDVRVDVVFDPPWDMSRVSEEAMLELGLL